MGFWKKFKMGLVEKVSTVKYLPNRANLVTLESRPRPSFERTQGSGRLRGRTGTKLALTFLSVTQTT